MSSIESQLVKGIHDASLLYHRLILLVGPPRSGKTTFLSELAVQYSYPMINTNLHISESLLEYTSKQRALKIDKLIEEHLQKYQSEILILDNIEVLFSPELQQDPLRLLLHLARNRTIIAAWPGEFTGDSLMYAKPSHPEFKRYQKPECIIVSIHE